MSKKSLKIGRNEPCPCGSGKKYKNCCRNKKLEIPIEQEYKRVHDVNIKTPEQIEKIRKSGELLLSIID